MATAVEVRDVSLTDPGGAAAHLMALLADGESYTTNEAAELLHFRRATIDGALSALAEFGAVRFRVGPRRAMRWTITELGRRWSRGEL